MILYIGQFKLFLSCLLTLFFFIHAPLLSSSGSIFLNSSPSITHSSSATSRLPYRWSFFGKGAEPLWTGVDGILPLGLGRGSSRFRGTYVEGEKMSFLAAPFSCPLCILSPLSLSLPLRFPPVFLSLAHHSNSWSLSNLQTIVYMPSFTHSLMHGYAMSCACACS